MANVSVFNMEGKEVGKIDLNDAVFGVEVNEHLVHMAVVQYLANKRQGTQKAKTRSEVSGGGRKPWRQKGTGHARQGSIRVQENKLIVVDELKFDEIKTKNFKAVMNNLKVNKALVVLGEKNENAVLSARNLETINTVYADSINVYEVLKGDTLVLTKDAVAKIEEVYA